MSLTDAYWTPSLLWQLWCRFKPIFRSNYACAGFNDLDRAIPDDVRNYVYDSYPRNHTYRAAGERLFPNRRLATRVSRISQFYPRPLRSLIDLSCSKGFFVFHAAIQPECERALGIDLDPHCLEVCHLLKARFCRGDRVAFASLSLPELALRIDELGGPFQTALLINTYQYLVFGSDVAPAVSHDHRQIFEMLRQVCSGRLVFHNRLSLSDLQSDPQSRADRDAADCIYEPDAIYEAASEFFAVQRLDPWSNRPIWLLDAR